MKVTDYEELVESKTMPIGEFVNLIEEAKERFEKRGCKEIHICIKGDNYGEGYLSIEGEREATEEEIKAKEIADAQPRKKVRITYVQRCLE